jgi:hypothetical protein
MNSVEDRLRDALRERAAHSPIDPDAWPRTVARSRRRLVSAPMWSRFMIPAAAAAAVVAIVAGTTVLTGHGGLRGGSGATGVSSVSPPASSPSASGAPAPPGPGSYLMRYDPPLSAIVPIKLTTGRQTTWTFVWFGRLKSDPGEGIQLCTVTDGGDYYGGGGCTPVQLQEQQGFVEGSDTIKLIVSDPQVTSVTALLPAGRSFSGLGAFGRGFPYKVWLVNFPTQDNATIVLRNAGGHVVKRMSITGEYPPPAQPRSGGIALFRYPADAVATTAGTMTAYLLDGRLVGVDGLVVGFWGSNSNSVISNVPASGPQTIVNLGGSWIRGATVVEYFGYAHQNVTRVVLRLADGRQYDAQTTVAWPGSGLRLWHFAVPVKAVSFEPAKQAMLGYDAAGQVVWDKSVRDSS